MIVNFWVSTTPGANSPRPFAQSRVCMGIYIVKSCLLANMLIQNDKCFLFI
jgi:ADP-glucose pyrophosphorylase